MLPFDPTVLFTYPDVVNRVQPDVVDIGCGGGRALRRLAAAFPASRFVGSDVDDAALALGSERAEQEGLPDVELQRKDCAERSDRTASSSWSSRPQRATTTRTCRTRWQ